jgi:hypothetical protein
VFNRILRHYIIWAFLPLMSRCSKSIQIKSPTTIIQLWAMYAIVVIYLGNLTHITDRGVGAKAKTLPFAPAFVYLAAPTGSRTTGEVHPSSSTLQDEDLRRRPPSHVLTQPGGPRGIQPIVTGPARRSVLRARFVIAFM